MATLLCSSNALCKEISYVILVCFSNPGTLPMLALSLGLSLTVPVHGIAIPLTSPAAEMS